MVQCGFGCSLLFRIHYTHVIFGCSCLLVHLVAGGESKMEIGLGLRTAILFVFLGLYSHMLLLLSSLQRNILVSSLRTVHERVYLGCRLKVPLSWPQHCSMNHSHWE